VRYLADTDYLIDASGNIAAALHTLAQLSGQGIAVSIVSLGELFEGAYGFPDPPRLLAGYRQFLATYPILPLTDPIMDRFAATRSHLRRTGMLIPDFDLAIAATAIHHDLTLLTRNLRHFARIPDLKLYQPS
jgi:predicted nucleic acid-binding protein